MAKLVSLSFWPRKSREPLYPFLNTESFMHVTLKMQLDVEASPPAFVQNQIKHCPLDNMKQLQQTAKVMHNASYYKLAVFLNE